MLGFNSGRAVSVRTAVARRHPVFMARLTSPSVRNNTQPIIQVLKSILPQKGTVLEIASGSGEHVCAFAKAFPNLTFQPSDVDSECLESTRAWAQELGLINVLPPLLIDTSREVWPVISADAVLCINMIHISPFACCEGLMRGAGKLLPPGGYLYLYGAYKINGSHTAPSNAAFDRSLRALNPSWGVRDLDDVKKVAALHGLSFVNIVDMPANNFSVIFQKSQVAPSG